MITLHQLIRSHFRRLFLLPFLALECLFVVLYFLVNYFVADKSHKELSFEHSQNIVEQLALQAEQLNSNLHAIHLLAELLQAQHQEHFTHSPPHIISTNSSPLIRSSNGSYRKEYNDGGASVFVSSLNAAEPQTRLKAEQTAYWDAQLRYSVEQSPLVVAAYFNSYDNFTRYYPFIDNVDQVFSANLQISDYNFYYLADYTHNPERQLIWTPAYLDPAGKGWMTSLIAPIYQGEKLEGVTGLDVSLSSIVSAVTRLQLPFAGESFLVDEQGRMIAMSAEIQTLLQLNALSERNYQRQAEINQEQPDEFLIQKLPYSSFRNSISAMFETNTRTGYVTQNGAQYLIASHPIHETNWQLFSITNADKLVSSLDELEESNQYIALLAMLLLGLFYLLFYYIQRHQADRLSERIQKPIRELVDPELGTLEASYDDIEEFILLNQRVQQTSQPELVAPQISSPLFPFNTRTVVDEAEACHDATQLLNRRGLMKQGEIELASAAKLKRPVALILFEVAEYQNLIEEHGIQSAEIILQQCIDCAKKVIPAHALLAHLTSAQFAILLPNTSNQQSLLLARRLRSELYLAIELGNSASISTQFALTQSELNQYESLQLMLERGHKLLEKCRGNRQNIIQTEQATFD